jgi:hypothetical protein
VTEKELFEYFKKAPKRKDTVQIEQSEDNIFQPLFVEGREGRGGGDETRNCLRFNSSNDL